MFAKLILQTIQDVRKSKDVRARLDLRMELWERGRIRAFIDDVIAEVGGTPLVRREKDDAAKARSYQARVVSGRLRSAVRGVTNRAAGGVLQPDDVCSKTGRPVLEVLQGKHPKMREPNLNDPNLKIFEEYPTVPQAVPLDITAETDEKVASHLSGAAGPSGTNAVDLSNWLLRHGAESQLLRNEMAYMARWLANDHPPWAAYRALMACRLVALDKEPGTRPVGIGEIYRRLFAKCVLEACGSQATTACGNLNLCLGLPAGIEGAVHAVTLVVAATAAADGNPELLTQAEPTTEVTQPPATQDFMTDEEVPAGRRHGRLSSCHSPRRCAERIQRAWSQDHALDRLAYMGRGRSFRVQLLPPRGSADRAPRRRPVLRHPLRGRRDPRGPAIHDLV